MKRKTIKEEDVIRYVELSKCYGGKRYEMSLDEAIEHADQKADELMWKATNCMKHPILSGGKKQLEGCATCSLQHRQLADWLRELKFLRKAVSDIQKEIQYNIDESKKNEEYHSEDVQNNTFMLRKGMELTQHIIEENLKKRKSE